MAPAEYVVSLFPMVVDHRLVQTAVLGNSESADPVYLPMERQDALRFTQRYQGSTFWCGVLLGGCGGQLSPKIYRAKVSHFAHYARTNDCTRRFGGIESADHLYAGKQVNRWLGSLGEHARKPEFTGDFETGGTCQRVTFPATDRHPAIFFEFSTEITEELDRLFTHMQGRSPSWLVRENLEFSRRLLRENGFALHFRMRTEGLERVLEVGTTGLSGSTHWEPISACTLTDQGLMTPRMEDLRKAHRQKAASKETVGTRTTPVEPPTEKPHPLITSLQFSLEQNDRANIRHFSHQLRSALNTSQDRSITGFRKKAEALLAWSSRLLAQNKRPPVAELKPLYRPPSFGRAAARPKADRSSSDRGKAQNSTQPFRKDEPRKQKEDPRPLEKRDLNTLINDALKAYDTGNQDKLRQVRAVLRKRRESASPGDRHRIDWVIESRPCADRERPRQTGRQKARGNGSSPPRQVAPRARAEESALRAAIAKRQEEIRATPEAGRKPRPPAPTPSLEELAERINSRRTR